MRNIGDKVWVYRFYPLAPEWVTCPDCGGTGRLRVTFHDETTVSIDCRNCSIGYDPPTGLVQVYKNTADVFERTIDGIDTCGDHIEYKTRLSSCSYNIFKENEVFDTKEEAIAAGEKAVAEYEREQKDKISRKEKDTRTWAWNASYHRREIERAERDLAYHKSKLAVASLKAKQERKA